MTNTIDAPVHNLTFSPMWASPQHGLWVASTDGEFLGMIERQDETYIATDRVGKPVGQFESLAAAQKAVDSEPQDLDDRRHVLTLKVILVASMVCSTIAGLGMFY